MAVNWEYFVLRNIGWVWLKCPVSGIARCPLLRGLNSIAINGERSVPEGNVLINERFAFQGVRKSRFHYIYTCDILIQVLEEKLNKCFIHAV